MHPMEWKHEKCTTGRLLSLNLANSEIIPGLDFDEHHRVRSLIDDPGNFPMLLYPGKEAHNLSEGGLGDTELGGRRLVVFLIDATWACAKVIARRNPGLLALPRLMFTARDRSRWVIKKQPRDWCLSTLEAAHELLISLDESGLDHYGDRSRLLEVFARMQEYQVSRRDSGRRARYLGSGSIT